MARLRARRAAGTIPILIDIDDIAVCEMLIANGYLSRLSADAEDRNALRTALEHFISDCVTPSRHAVKFSVNVGA